MIDAIQKALAQLAEIQAMKNRIGMILTQGQQMGVSRALAIDPEAFKKWMATDAGITATRAYADAFLTPPVSRPVTSLDVAPATAPTGIPPIE